MILERAFLAALSVSSWLIVARSSNPFGVRIPRISRWTAKSPSKNGSTFLISRGGNDDGVTIHGASTTANESLYLPGLLDTIIHRTNEVGREGLLPEWPHSLQ